MGHLRSREITVKHPQKVRWKVGAASVLRLSVSIFNDQMVRVSVVSSIPNPDCRKNNDGELKKLLFYLFRSWQQYIASASVKTCCVCFCACIRRAQACMRARTVFAIWCTLISCHKAVVMLAVRLHLQAQIDDGRHSAVPSHKSMSDLLLHLHTALI